MNLNQEIQALEDQRQTAIDQERVDRAAAFLHTRRHPLHERIAGFPAVPLSLFHCNLLQMINSPFLPPFGTPTETDLVAFLWIVNPAFMPGESRAKKKFRAGGRKFFPPPEVYYNWKWLHKLRQQKAGMAMFEFTAAVVEARNYVNAAMADRPPARGHDLIEQEEYYSDFAALSMTLMYHCRGISHEEAQFLPLKVIYQYLKIIEEISAAKAGEKAMLWNGSDRFMDQQLALLNRRDKNN